VAGIRGAAWLPACVVGVVPGASRRQESVAAGVAAARKAAEMAGFDVPTLAAAAVLIHDAARPLASPALVRAVAAATVLHGASIPVLAVPETLKRLEGDRVGETVDRTNVVTAQTPQGVRLGLIERAYGMLPPADERTWTDEASLLEACRIPVQAIPGEATNLKVTVPADLERAKVMLDAGLVPGTPAASPRVESGSGVPAVSARVGFGTDGHSFGPGRPLMLGGVRIEGAPRLVGHSDGDAALHAVADALLGGAGLGDLGRVFPADHRTPQGIASGEMLATVAGRVRSAGWQIVSIDLTITAARPRLAGLLQEMEKAIAAAAGIDSSSVNVKASTGNLAGNEGAGRSISADAIAWLVRAPRAGEA
jgi:2-C-methyl-D-erythritol 2,4-cyclodiphosphate synthase/2-C-methyl-D-erythritol 4-phosphate cytidylyltransferase